MGDLSILGLVEKFALAEIAIHHAANRALERVAVKVEQTAKDEFGEYQSAVGPFPAWAELADATKEDRVRLGFTENDPLLRTGETRDSIQHRTGNLETVIGSDSDILEFHEFGTSRMPPRPVLGPAVERNIDAIVGELGGAVVNGLVGGEVVRSVLGYDRVVGG